MWRLVVLRAQYGNLSRSGFDGGAAYHSTENAILYWPETATAVAVRLGDNDLIEVIAPYALNDRFELRLRPTPVFEREKYDPFRRRGDEKRWLARYPQLQLITVHRRCFVASLCVEWTLFYQRFAEKKGAREEGSCEGCRSGVSEKRKLVNYFRWFFILGRPIPTAAMVSFST